MKIALFQINIQRGGIAMNNTVETFDIDKIVADMRKIAVRQKEAAEKKLGLSFPVCENPMCGYPCVGSYHQRGSHKFCSSFCAETTTGLEFDPFVNNYHIDLARRKVIETPPPIKEVKLRSKEETWDIFVDTIRKHGDRRVPVSFLMTLKELDLLDTLMALHNK